ncbi:MAG: glycosyltransferase family protein [Candidatus Margulisiibacteriota bacterium]
MKDNDKKKQIDVIVEARMTSSRLPGKTLFKAAGKPLLELMIERLRRIPEIDNVIVATTENTKDDLIADLCKRCNVACFRGDEDDVLGRVVKAAKRFGTDIIVEITGDNPLVDPGISSQVIKEFLKNEKNIDYAANDVMVTFPIGFNTRAFSRALLEKVERSTNDPVDREHVVNYICKRPDEFRMHNIAAKGPLRRTDIRLTMDTAEDYKVIKSVFEALYPSNHQFLAQDIIDYLDKNPDIKNINKEIVQRTYDY